MLRNLLTKSMLSAVSTFMADKGDSGKGMLLKASHVNPDTVRGVENSDDEEERDPFQKLQVKEELMPRTPSPRALSEPLLPDTHPSNQVPLAAQALSAANEEPATAAGPKADAELDQTQEQPVGQVSSAEQALADAAAAPAANEAVFPKHDAEPDRLEVAPQQLVSQVPAAEPAFAADGGAAPAPTPQPVTASHANPATVPDGKPDQLEAAPQQLVSQVPAAEPALAADAAAAPAPNEQPVTTSHANPATVPKPDGKSDQQPLCQEHAPAAAAAAAEATTPTPAPTQQPDRVDVPMPPAPQQPISQVLPPDQAPAPKPKQAAAGVPAAPQEKASPQRHSASCESAPAVPKQTATGAGATKISSWCVPKSVPQLPAAPGLSAEEVSSARKRKAGEDPLITFNGMVTKEPTPIHKAVAALKKAPPAAKKAAKKAKK